MSSSTDGAERTAGTASTEGTTGTGGTGGTEATGVSTDPASQQAAREQLRALAHPLRLEIMDRIGRRGTARAADLAVELGIPANSVSYHLRILARGGVVQEAPEAARDRRDRVWTLKRTTFDVGSGVGHSPGARDPEYLAATGAVSLAAFDWMRAGWGAEIARSTPAHARPGEGLGTLVATTLRLSTEQAKELNDRIAATVNEYSRLNRDEDLSLLPGDPDSDGEAHSFRVLWAAVGEQSPAHDEEGPREAASRD